MLVEIHNPKLFLPESLKRLYPSHLHIDIMKRGQVSAEIWKSLGHFITVRILIIGTRKWSTYD